MDSTNWWMNYTINYPCCGASTRVVGVFYSMIHVLEVILCEWENFEWFLKSVVIPPVCSSSPFHRKQRGTYYGVFDFYTHVSDWLLHPVAPVLHPMLHLKLLMLNDVAGVAPFTTSTHIFNGCCRLLPGCCRKCCHFSTVNIQVRYIDYV